MTEAAGKCPYLLEFAEPIVRKGGSFDLNFTTGHCRSPFLSKRIPDYPGPFLVEREQLEACCRIDSVVDKTKKNVTPWLQCPLYGEN